MSIKMELTKCEALEAAKKLKGSILNGNKHP